MDTNGNLECQCPAALGAGYQKADGTEDDYQVPLSAPGFVPGESSGRFAARVFGECQGKTFFLNSKRASKKTELIISWLLALFAPSNTKAYSLLKTRNCFVILHTKH